MIAPRPIPTIPHPDHAVPIPDPASLARERRRIDEMIDGATDPGVLPAPGEDPGLSPFAAELIAGLAEFCDALRAGTVAEKYRIIDLYPDGTRREVGRVDTREPRP